VALQSLRGIAAAVVLMRHATLSYPIASKPITETLEIVLNSHAAVVVFFVLSGFVLSASLEGRRASFPAFAGFYAKRLFRIVPLLIVVTVLSAIFTIAAFSSVAVPGTTAFFSGLLTHGPLKPVVLILALAGMNSHFVPQNWTIAAELLVAPIFPVLFFAARSNWKTLGLMLAIGALASVAARPDAGWVAILYVNDFLIGIFVYLLWLRNVFALRHLWPAAIVALPLLLTARPLLVALHLPMVSIQNFHDAKTGLIEALSAAVIIYALASEGWITRHLSKKIPVFLGDISYSLYLVHLLVLVLLVRLFDRLGPSFNGQSALTKDFIMAACVFAVSVLAAIFFYYAVEMPFNRLGRRLAAFDKPARRQAFEIPATAITQRTRA
jgi:peptidoglycan/LPS O-acetylase OafA/YrhL